MNQRIFKALQEAGKQELRPDNSICPENINSKLLEMTDDRSLLEHVAFCRSCQLKLREMHHPHESYKQEKPDLDLLIRQLKRKARWFKIKEWLNSGFKNIHDYKLFKKVPIMARTFNPNQQSNLELVILEVNLSNQTALSHTQLHVNKLLPIPDEENFLLEISGFSPELVNSPCRLGLAVRTACLKHSGVFPETAKISLIEIEKHLQNSFTNSDSDNRSLQTLIKETLWLSGQIEASSFDSSSCCLRIQIPEKGVALLLTQEFWSILIVGAEHPDMFSDL